MNRVYLLLGGNEGDVKHKFKLACELIGPRIGKLLLKSPLYQSEAWGFSSEALFLNQVVVIDTHLNQEVVLNHILIIENELGRKRKANSGEYQNRTIDIDILFFNNLICETPFLTIPHPRLHLRKFTLCPLNDIAPALVHPVFQKTIEDLLAICPDTSEVFRTE